MARDHWFAVSDGDPRLLGHYLCHYSSKKARGTRRNRKRGGKNGNRVIGPGERLALLTPCNRACVVWRKSRYRKDSQVGVECVIFRNVGPWRSSCLIREAVTLAWHRWPGERLFTMVNPKAIKSTNPGWCFLAAGWVRLKAPTKGGLRVLELMPPAGEEADGWRVSPTSARHGVPRVGLNGWSSSGVSDGNSG